MSRSPALLRENTGMSDDPLSETLAVLDTRCVLARTVTAAGSWSLALRSHAPLMLVGAARGEFWLAVAGVERPVHLTQGDVVVLRGFPEQVMSGAPDLEPVDGEQLFAQAPGESLHLAADPQVAVIGCHIGIDRTGGEHLLEALDPVTHIRSRDASAPLLHALLDRLLTETTRPAAGSDFAARQYAGLMFVEVLRRHLADPDAYPPSWLRLLVTPTLAGAVRAMHAAPEHDWSLEELARTVAMSRTTFAERFRQVAGLPPLTYLGQWRMRLAGQALRRGDMTIAALSHSLGYATESSFSHAFKRTHGIAPGQYRENLAGTGRR